MYNLMKIDIAKFNLKKQPLYFFIVNAIMAIMIYSILYLTNGVVEESAPVIIDVITKPVFIVWEAILIAMIIIDEFKNKTILMLYTYPLDKKKLILSKVILILLYSIVGIISSQIFLNLLFWGISQVIPTIPYVLVWKQVIAYTLSSIMIVLLGLIPLCIGLIKYSTIATIATSVAIITIGSSSGLGFDQLLSQISVVSTMGIIGTVATIISITKMFKRDIIV
jgi:hypothetical protein